MFFSHFYYNKSITWFLLCRSANVEDIFNVNVFFKCKCQCSINDNSFKYIYHGLLNTRPYFSHFRGHRKQSKVMLRNWMGFDGLTFFLFEQKYFIIFNCLLCAFKTIIIKGIAYVQCQRWVIKLNFKRKAFGELFAIRKKLFYVKRKFMCRETFDVIFYIFEKWRRVQKKY